MSIKRTVTNKCHVFFFLFRPKTVVYVKIMHFLLLQKFAGAILEIIAPSALSRAHNVSIVFFYWCCIGLALGLALIALTASSPWFSDLPRGCIILQQLQKIIGQKRIIIVLLQSKSQIFELGVTTTSFYAIAETLKYNHIQC